jgi:hypothetical protein
VVKLWNLKSNECMNTFDSAHTEKIWAMCLVGDGAAAAAGSGSSGMHLVTGGGDSTLAVWADLTVQQQSEAREQAAATVKCEQQLLNALARGQYLKATELALTLKQPRRLLTVLTKVVSVQTAQDAAKAAAKQDGEDAAPAPPSNAGLKSIVEALSVPQLGSVSAACVWRGCGRAGDS